MTAMAKPKTKTKAKAKAVTKTKTKTKTRTRTAATGSNAEAVLRAYALSLPGAVEEFPWGDRVMKVNKKVFVFMGQHEDGSLGLSTKLPRSAEIALTLPFAEPTGYGLGKSGWVSARFEAKERPPVDMLKAWIEESYRAIAPKKMVAALDGVTKR
jgi:predicted DNA-binding protein (MmcQ/YjbR family)